MPMFWSRKQKSVPSGAPKKASARSSAKKDGSSAKKVENKPGKAIAIPVITENKESRIAEVIIRPHFTEKAGILSQGGVYTFEVQRGANKSSVMNAMKSIYKVTPVKVAMINMPAKQVFLRGRKGVVGGFRKAVITLKKGDKIDFI